MIYYLAKKSWTLHSPLVFISHCMHCCWSIHFRPRIYIPFPKLHFWKECFWRFAACWYLGLPRFDAHLKVKIGNTLQHLTLSTQDSEKLSMRCCLISGNAWHSETGNLWRWRVFLKGLTIRKLMGVGNFRAARIFSTNISLAGFFFRVPKLLGYSLRLIFFSQFSLSWMFLSYFTSPPITFLMVRN